MKREINKKFILTKLDNWDDIFKLNPIYISKFIFRGQANKQWGLETSIERQIKKLYPNLADKTIISSQEKEMIKDFQWKYPLYSNKIPEPDDFVEWLTIMQHYGSVTRLLDFSFSIFVAMYMAVFNNGDSGALWAINKKPIDSNVLQPNREQDNKIAVGDDVLDLYYLKLANEAIKNNHEAVQEKKLFIIKPNMSNERLSRQQGLFVMPSDVKCSFMDCLNPYLSSQEPIELRFKDLIDHSHTAKYDEEDISIIKIVIPKVNNYTITKHLRTMNLTAEMLFPGLEGLAQSMNFGRSGSGQKD